MQPRTVDPDILEYIPNCITHEHNMEIAKCPQEDEIKDSIFYMNSDSAAGPDGFSGKFFHFCWDIIKKDVIEFVQFFFKKRN